LVTFTNPLFLFDIQFYGHHLCLIINYKTAEGNNKGAGLFIEGTGRKAVSIGGSLV